MELNKQIKLLDDKLSKEKIISNEKRQEFINAINLVSLNFSDLKNVQGIVVGGSVARGFCDDDSDIEMYVYYDKLIPSEKDIANILKEIDADLTRSNKLHWNHSVWGTHTFFMTQGVSFELGYRNIKSTKNKVQKYLSGEDIFSRPTKEHDTPLGHYTSGIANCITESFIIYENDKAITKLKEEVNFPKKLYDTIFSFYYQEAEVMTDKKLKSHALRNDNRAFFTQLSAIVRAMDICVFTLNKTHFPGDKWVDNYIHQFRIMPADYDHRTNMIINTSHETRNDKAYKCLIVETLLKNLNELYKHSQP